MGETHGRSARTAQVVLLAEMTCTAARRRVGTGRDVWGLCRRVGVLSAVVVLTALLAGCGSGGASLSARGREGGPTSGPTSSVAPAGESTTTASTASTVSGATTAGTGASGSGTAGPGTIVSTGATGSTSPPAPTSTSSTTTTAPLHVPAGSGAYGYVTAGPTCPVERAGQPCPPRPVSAEVDARNGAGATVASTTSDSSGRYALTLAAGSYTLVVVTSSGFPRCPDTPVTVRTGAATRADISCDTGIR